MTSSQRFRGRCWWGLLALMVLVCGCAYVPEPPPVGDHPPVLDGWYASPTATWGQTWKIYIKAHDVDGDLWEARFNIDQLGVTYSDADAYTILTKEYWNGIDGYFFLQIPDRSMSFGPINLVMSVVLMDRGGRKSQEIQNTPKSWAPASTTSTRRLC